MLTLIPLTTSISTSRFPHTIKIKQSKENGLKKVSIAMVFQIRSLDKRRILHVAGHLEEQYMKEIEESLQELLSL